MQHVDGKYDIDCIANNEESYKTFTFLKKYTDKEGKERTVKTLKFLEACQFLTGTLEANASSLVLDQFKYTLQKFGTYDKFDECMIGDKYGAKYIFKVGSGEYHFVSKLTPNH